MKEDHREKAVMALNRFRKEVREAGFSEDELSDILGHISALEQEVQAPKPDPAVMQSSTQALDDITHSPEVTDALARVVRFFNSIGIQERLWSHFPRRTGSGFSCARIRNHRLIFERICDRLISELT
jgi:hypothetical protein